MNKNSVEKRIAVLGIDLAKQSFQLHGVNPDKKKNTGLPTLFE